MNTTRTLEITTASAAQTERVAEKLGARLHGGEVVELVSDLGGGKTTFTRGLVRGAGSGDRVRSPTFTLSSEYKAPNFTIAHFDFYRLGEAGIVGDELAEVIDDPHYVVVVEWGDIVRNVLPTRRLTLRMLRTEAGEDVRKLTFEYPEELNYLLEGVK